MEIYSLINLLTLLSAHVGPIFLSYINNSINLQSKSIELFLYDENVGLKWVKYECIFTDVEYWLGNLSEKQLGRKLNFLGFSFKLWKI